MEDKIKKIVDRAELIQKELHEFIDMVKQDPKAKDLTYDSLKDVFLYMKIAELQKEISQLKSVVLPLF